MAPSKALLATPRRGAALVCLWTTVLQRLKATLEHALSLLCRHALNEAAAGVLLVAASMCTVLLSPGHCEWKLVVYVIRRVTIRLRSDI